MIKKHRMNSRKNIRRRSIHLPEEALFHLRNLSSVLWLVIIIPTKVIRLPDVDLLLGQRLRRWPNNKSTSGKRLEFSGMVRCNSNAAPRVVSKTNIIISEY